MPYAIANDCLKGYSLAHNTDLSFYRYLNANPENSKRFAAAMQAFGEGPDISPSFLVKSYPWASLGGATIVDLGGSNGSVSTAIAQAYPTLRFVVQDRPEVINAIEPLRKELYCLSLQTGLTLWRMTFIPVSPSPLNSISFAIFLTTGLMRMPSRSFIS